MSYIAFSSPFFILAVEKVFYATILPSILDLDEVGPVV